MGNYLKLTNFHFGVEFLNKFSSKIKKHPTPVLLPGKSHGWRSLVGCNPWGRSESDTTERLHFHFSLWCIGEGNGNPLQYSCLENPTDRGPWWAMVHTVAKSQTRLQRLSTHSADPTESEFSTLFSSFILKIKPLLPASTILIATLWLVCAHAKLISNF